VTISDAVRTAVLERDGHACVCCGRSIYGQRYSLQHRRARKAGGSRLRWIDQPQNLVTVCGSATSPDGCHFQVMESRDPLRDAQTLGYVISEWPQLDPKFIPVHVVTEFQTAKVWLTPGGGLADYPPAEGVIFQDLLFCPGCRTSKLHTFEDGAAACIRCGNVQNVDETLACTVIELRFCTWCRQTLPVGHQCAADETRCESRTRLGTCGICAACLTAQVRWLAAMEAS
jgi:hypothetical protein